jgi:hypothetical protein
MILTTLILLALQSAPTLGAMERLSPQAAGEVVLAGQDHGPIVKIAPPKFPGMSAPGGVERQMVERPVASAGGCVRRRWILGFFHGPDVTQDEAALNSVSSTTEVALAGPTGCPDDGYAQLNGDITPAQAHAALGHLDDLRLRDAKAQFSCSDETRSNLCADTKTIRRELAKLSAWAVMRRNGETVFWLGGGGGAVTEVRYALTGPDRVVVERRIPAPF